MHPARLPRFDVQGAEAPAQAEARPVTPEQSVSALPDDDLVQLLPARGAGAEQALVTLYERYASSVYGLVLRMVSDAGLAEDLLQETFWRLWLHAAQYQPGRVRFATWLLRVATNVAISELRKRSRRPRAAGSLPAGEAGGDGQAPPSPDPADPAPDVPDQVWLAEQRRLVVAGLALLPEVQRQAVELAYYGGMSHAEIAAAQGAPLSTVKTRLALGLRKLADFLQGRGVVAEDLRS